MNPNLNVKVSADIKDLERNLRKGGKRVDDFGHEVKRTEGSVKKFSRTTQVNAVPALTSFSQVMQDAPYGIRGVANNITQLTSQMGYLSKSAGGIKGAFKAMASQLMGPAGILMAVSIVTSLMVSFGDELFKTGDKAKSAADKLEDFKKELNDLASAHLKGAQSAAKELVQLKLLSQQATNATLSTKNRKAAVDELRRLYPGYLKNMSDEEILANGLSSAYDKVATSILKKARAQASGEKIVENTKKQLELEAMLAANKANFSAQELKAKNAEELAVTAISKNLAGQEVLRQKALKERQKVNDLLKEQKSLTGQIQGLELSNIDLLQNVKESGDLIVTPKFKELDNRPIRVPITPVLQGSDFGFDDRDWNTKIAEDAFIELEAISSKALSGMQEDIILMNTTFTDNLESLQFQATMASEIFGQMANQIADSMLTGKFSIEDFVKGVVKSFANMLIQLGQQAIMEKILGKAQMGVDQGVANANAIVMASNAAVALGPAGVMAYPGLLAQSLAITNGAFSGIHAFNDGGIVGGGMVSGDKVLARLNSGEMVLNQSQQRGLFNMLNGPATGGSEPLEIVGESRISGDTIITAYKRAESRNNRIS